jgi:hypothetical protein
MPWVPYSFGGARPRPSKKAKGRIQQKRKPRRKR